jgi:4-oxalocrotonate tautomerase family enzyme
MPIVHMYFAKGSLSNDTKRKLLSGVTELLFTEANEKKEFTTVMIHEVNPEDAMIGGKTLLDYPKFKERLETMAKQQKNQNLE